METKFKQKPPENSNKYRDEDFAAAKNKKNKNKNKNSKDNFLSHASKYNSLSLLLMLISFVDLNGWKDMMKWENEGKN